MNILCTFHVAISGYGTLSTQQYKVWIKGKVEQFRERSTALPNTLL